MNQRSPPRPNSGEPDEMGKACPGSFPAPQNWGGGPLICPSPPRQSPPPFPAKTAVGPAAASSPHRTAPSPASDALPETARPRPPPLPPAAECGINSRCPPLRRPLPPRLLHGMGGIKHDGIAETAHDRQRFHVHDQRVVAETRPPLGQQQVLIARSRHFLHHVFHVPGSQKLAFFDIDDPPAFARRQQ